MGTTPSSPSPTAKLKVIGAGLPRTGTTSLSAALELLLNAPVFHAGTQHILSSSETPILTATRLLRAHNPRPILHSLFDSGYVAVCDSPYAQFTPELLQLYPDAIVICTIRATEPWLKSFQTLVQTGQSASGWHTALVPVARLMPDFMRAMYAGRIGELYPAEAPLEEMLKSVVSPEKLFFIDVQDGWEPLCRALKLPIPEGVEFPRVNDSGDLRGIARRFVLRGIVSWCVVTSALVAALGIAWRLWQRVVIAVQPDPLRKEVE